MRTLLKVLGIIAAVLVLLIVVSAISINVMAAGKMSAKYPMPVLAVPPIPTDSASIARGRHIAEAVSNCVECHAADLGGNVFMDAGPLGVVAGPNLTRGRGGVGAVFTDEDWVRSIKYGMRADSTSLMIMPSEAFVHMSDTDLGALIAYLKQLPPVDREVPRSHLRFLGKALMVTGALPVMVAGTVPAANAMSVTPGVTAEYGRYLADISGCRGCHAANLSGGTTVGPPDAPPTANLTPAGPIGKWSEADFLRLFREGKRPDGTMITDFMPWRVMGNMTDDELRAILMYLRTVPGLPTGTKVE